MTVTYGSQFHSGSSAGNTVPLDEELAAPDGRLHQWLSNGTSATALDHGTRFFSPLAGTTSGWSVPAPAPGWGIVSGQAAVRELRSRTRLTWSQLARALGVHRRSLHLWAQGKRPNASNLERLMRLVEIVRNVDQGDPDTTTSLLLDPQRGEPSIFSLLCRDAAGDARGASITNPRQRKALGPRRPPALSPSERSRRRAVAPLERLVALQDGMSYDLADADGAEPGSVEGTSASPGVTDGLPPP